MASFLCKQFSFSLTLALIEVDFNAMFSLFLTFHTVCTYDGTHGGNI